MHHCHRRLGYANIIATLALFLALGGGAWAVSRASSTQIRACESHSGSLRVIRHGTCRRTEHLLSWNTVGPHGPAGQTGPQGPQGPAGSNGQNGAAGTLSAYEAQRTSVFDITTTGSFMTVATLSNLPAGSYAISAHAVVDNHTDTMDTGQVTCELVAGADSDSSYTYLLGGTDAMNLPMSVTHTFSAPGSAVVECEKQLAHSAFVQNVDIVATQVASQTRTQVSG
jgi:hypothetical protein